MNINYHKIDCMEFMKSTPDKYYKVAIVDPNYGRNQHGGTSRTKRVLQKNGSRKLVTDGQYELKSWDSKPADQAYFDELLRVSEHQIIFGCNYYTSNFGDGRIIWDKVNEGSDQSDCEIAYNSLTTRVDLFRFMWRGMMQGKSIAEGHIQQGNKKLNEKRIHPTQKPTSLYKWILKNYIPKDWNILDTHGGSRSLGIACLQMGYTLDSCEIDDSYHESSTNWKNEVLDKINREPQLQFV